jgi:hypothetical protein
MLAGLMAIAPARAGTISPPTYVNVFVLGFDTAGSYVLGHTEGTFYGAGGSYGTVIKGPTPYVHAHGGFTADLSYSFEIFGPGGLSVPVVVTWNAQASVATGSSVSSSARYQFAVGANPYFDQKAYAGSTLTNQGPTTYFFPTNTVEGVTMHTVTSIDGDAFIDPSFVIDPGFFTSNPGLDPAAFSLVVSTGVGNSPLDASPTPASVPEPASMALLGAGVLALSAMRRKAA